MNENNGLAVQEERSYFLAPAASLAELRERYKLFGQFVKEMLKDGTDYQTIPGTNKPSLAKPGAEKLGSLFGLSERFIPGKTIEDWSGADHNGEPFFYYVYRCELYRGERFIASCDGSCNSWEKKYRYRESKRKCPICGKEAIIKGKVEYGGGWVCFKKQGGCNAKFKDGDQRIDSQTVGLVRNEDIFDQVNTFQKMAQKRAYVGATLLATNASEYFTQDVEDMSQFGGGDVTEGNFIPEPEQPRHQATTATEQPTNGNGNHAPIVANGFMPLEQAILETNTNGQSYNELPTATLSNMANSLGKKIQAGEYAEPELSEKIRKLAAARSILHSREVK